MGWHANRRKVCTEGGTTNLQDVLKRGKVGRLLLVELVGEGLDSVVDLDQLLTRTVLAILQREGVRNSRRRGGEEGATNLALLHVLVQLGHPRVDIVFLLGERGDVTIDDVELLLDGSVEGKSALGELWAEARVDELDLARDIGVEAVRAPPRVHRGCRRALSTVE